MMLIMISVERGGLSVKYFISETGFLVFRYICHYKRSFNDDTHILPNIWKKSFFL